MGFWAIIALILKWGSAGVSVINLLIELKELIEKLREMGRKDEATFATAALSNAMTQYEKHKDRRLLLALRERLRADCFGGNCDVPGAK